MPGEEVNDFQALLNRLKEQLPDSLKHHKDTVAMLQMMLKHRNDIVAWLSKNLGTNPQIREFIELNRAVFGTLDRGGLDSLIILTRFLGRWDDFLSATLPRLPWVCPRCKQQNGYWHTRCSACGEPRDLFADDFTKHL